MKALVLAGGFGTRLRPLSCSRPKPLFPVANKPIIDYTLQSLTQAGVDTVIVSVHYMADKIADYLGTSKHGMDVIVSRERRPLGKGGGIKNAEKLLGDEQFTVINGDIITDIDISRLTAFHEGKGGLATIALHRVEDPSRYGSVELDGEDRITRFVEKPGPGQAPSNLINAGVYVLEPELLDYMPPARKFDTEEEIFPVLAKEGKMFGFEAQGYWSDVGVPGEYLNANAAVLGKMSGDPLNVNADVDPGATVKKPCVLGDHVHVGADSVIGPNVSIMDGSHVGRGVTVENSIILAGATFMDGGSVRDAIIGEGVVLERGVKVEPGTLIGDYVQIGAGVTLAGGVSICPYKSVKESILEPRRVM